MKTCSKCKEKYEATSEFFQKNAQSKSGLRPECKKCSHKKEKKYRENNKSKISEYKKKWYRNNRDTQASSTLKRKFNITIDDYNNMLKDQDFSCKICGKHVSEATKGYKKYLCVDHCHSTGKIRGLLCNVCNVGLGHFEDDTGRMLKAIRYLKDSH